MFSTICLKNFGSYFLGVSCLLSWLPVGLAYFTLFDLSSSFGGQTSNVFKDIIFSLTSKCDVLFKKLLFSSPLVAVDGVIKLTLVCFILEIGLITMGLILELSLGWCFRLTYNSKFGFSTLTLGKVPSIVFSSIFDLGLFYWVWA